MDISALLNRKVELIDLRDDEDCEIEGHEEQELEELLELESELGCTLESADQNGLFFIDEDYFEDYAKELAYDIGAIDSDAAWPCTHIDWDAAANELRMDYTEVEFDGNNYLVRI
jgi:hypothetical protein